MTNVKLFGLDVEVEYNESDVNPVRLDNGDEYEEAVITTDGQLIAFDEAVCDWVRLGTEDDAGYEFI